MGSEFSPAANLVNFCPNGSSNALNGFPDGHYGGDYNTADMCSKRLPKRIQDGRVRCIMKFSRKLQNKKKNEAFVAHFRLLGLRRGECRTNVIRSAAQAMSLALSYSGDHHARNSAQHFEDDVRRAKIAVATYRLLDPRERVDIYERVQLCYPLDRDEGDSPATSTRKLIDQMPKVQAKIRRQAGTDVKLMGQPLIHEAIEGNLPADEEPEAAPVDKFSKRGSSELSLDERRGIVRLMRESNESILRGLSPLGWLRSRLGI